MTWKEVIIQLYETFLTDVLPTTESILKAPFWNADAVWLVAPLLVVLVFMSLYFGKHRNEELGWNTAFGNSISLIFVSTLLMKYMWQTYDFTVDLTQSFVEYKLILIGFMFIQAFSLLFLDFFHTLPKRFAFFFSSPVFINTTAFLGIALVYGDIAMDWITLWAALLVYLLVFVATFVMRKIVRPSEQAKKFLKRKADEKKEKKRVKRAIRTRKIHDFEEQFLYDVKLVKRKVREFFDKMFGWIRF